MGKNKQNEELEEFFKKHPLLKHIIFYSSALFVFYIIFWGVDLWNIFYTKETPEPSYFLFKLSLVYVSLLYLLSFFLKYAIIRAIFGFFLVLALSLSVIVYFIDDKSFGLLLEANITLKIVMGISLLLSIIGAWIGYTDDYLGSKNKKKRGKTNKS